MSALSICLLLLGSVLLVTAELDCSNQHTDGCSIPFNLPWFYKDEFTPECRKHDICYACVSKLIIITCYMLLCDKT